MTSYFDAVKAELKDWKASLLVIVLTVARIIYGYSWLHSGLGKATTWFSDGKLNAAPKIQTLVTNIAGPKVTSFDPLYINKFFGWVANTIFLGMPAVTDVLVVVFEISVGVLMILGFRVFWGALIAIFMNIQFMAGASFNNFGYIWTDLAMLKFSKYAELLGLDGFLRYKRNQKLLQTSSERKAA